MVNGFVKACGQKIVNGEGQEFLLRGVGLGGWTLPEGYMWRFPEQGDRPRRMEKMTVDLIGEPRAREFWETYYDRYTSEDDIARIAAEGFNSVRIPVNSRFLIEETDPVRYHERHLKLLDRALEWCGKYNLYAILDLHGAPGGQTGTNIDDSENDCPELFTNEENRKRTIDLWRMLAERYRDEWIIAGYDLLNEPLPEWFSEHNGKVMPLYRDIIKEIRKVDQRHMIILEGVHWATDWTIFDGKPDANLMLQFHKYWSNPDTESIRGFLDKRREWDVPIFMGEGGENNLNWYSGAFRLYEDHDISWNFWTWKKMGADNSPCLVKAPADWQKLVDFLKGGERPDPETAEKILWEYLDNIRIDRCDYHPGVVNALFRRAPVSIPAIFYGYRGEGVSYGIADRSDTKTGFRKNDGTDIRFVDESASEPNFRHMAGEAWEAKDWMHIRLGKGDWLAYEFTTASSENSNEHKIEIIMRAATGKAGISVSVDGIHMNMGQILNDSWKRVQADARLNPEPGLHRILLKCENGPVDIQLIEIK